MGHADDHIIEGFSKYDVKCREFKYQIVRCVSVKNMIRLARVIQCAALWGFALRLGTGVSAAEYQKPCIDVPAYFENVLAHVKLLERRDVLPDEAYEQKAAELLNAGVSDSHCLFNVLSDSEALTLVKALSRFEEKTVSAQVLLWDSFLEHYPRSPHVDEARWLRARTEATPYEYEGAADAALQQIEQIELFIKENPGNSFLTEAKLELARACRIAYETFRYGSGLSTSPNENRRTAGMKYRDRARLVLRGLCDHSSDSARSEACRALRDLDKGLCVYMGPGSPNPDSPDNWSSQKNK